ncbi:cyclin [Metarhizium album ARSEF 1941]|uniref:Cyclin n=1 Tax=Metarhizium album (strain ARSEF 1941) TaxID=1081103 RepID=A0A0B2WEE8_METAS|nr:cyclin [Metarhizium album ARSEF 1941]KHN94221.1 cyclin [Metarhizium album ARSEF 1941]
MAHLANPLATTSQLYQHASLSSLPHDLQESIFIATQCLTQAAGQLLDLPQSVTARANVILARYWLVDSPMAHEFSDVSAAAIYLVAKVGPVPRSPRDVSNVYAYLLSSNSTLFKTGDLPRNDPKTYYQSDADYFSFQNRLLALESRILYALTFDTHAALPYALAITYLQTMDFLSQPKSSISRKTIQHLNTALLSPQMLYLTHQPNALATAAIYNAARDVGAKMPDCEWWEVFDVDREELGFLVVGMRSVDGWFRRRKEETPELFKGMLTRKAIEGEIMKRGLQVSNDGGQPDEEAEVMKIMDGR